MISLRKFIPLAVIAALFIILIVSFLFIRPRPAELEYGEEEPLCIENQTKECLVGNCTGASTCTGGGWGPCRLELVCTPGETVPCLDGPCVCGYKECNECGSAFGPCISEDGCG